MKRKIGRNDLCPCKSGVKYKKCHLNMKKNPYKGLQQIYSPEAKEYQRREQQGLGKPIISESFAGHRFVAVGNKLISSEKWKTFPDFLSSFIIDKLGREWFLLEKAKPLEERHPILQWHYHGFESPANTTIQEHDGLKESSSGASTAYFQLAYNLYLLEHNPGIQSVLVERLKGNNDFHGPLYETYVAAYFVKAGFHLEFEDEQDSTTNHCEFIATHKDTQRKFSVEAKAQDPHKPRNTNVRNQLYKALKKEANHDRIIFIELGVETTQQQTAQEALLEAVETVRSAEGITIKNKPTPSAYVVITINSFWHDLHGTDFGFAALVEGYKIDDFRDDVLLTIDEALESREKHKEVLALFESIEKHQRIPSTFDGENPEIIFHKEADDKNPRLIIGKGYLISREGKDQPAILKDVTVNISETDAMCVYEFQDAHTVIMRYPLSEQELRAYKAHPDTYFGQIKKANKEAKSPLEFYDWILGQAKRYTKERLLSFLSDSHAKEELEGLSKEELAETYAKGVFNSVHVDQE